MTEAMPEPNLPGGPLEQPGDLLDALPDRPPTPEEPLPGDEMSLEQKEVAGLSQSQIVRKRFLRHKAAMVSLVVLVLVLLLAVSSIGWGFIPGWWKWNAYTTVGDPAGQRATLAVLWIGGPHFFSMGNFPFGASTVGIDNFAQVMRGIQQTTVVILIIGVLSTLIGVVLGAIAGYYRGWVDSVLMRFTDLVLTMPIILVVAVLAVLLNASGVWPVGLAIALLIWPQQARLVRAEFLTLREREFVDAARVAGASDRRIIFKHILPNTVSVIVVNATLQMSGGILLEAALSYLGFGITFPDVSLGSLISNYQGAILTGEPYLFIWPGVFIIIIVMCLNFIGDGLRDAYDPRQKRIPNARDLRKSRLVQRAQFQSQIPAEAATT